ncbi:hypothetical protein [Halorussus marinus]|uniref:hypothetical protein n=1 Tax=Halorussus marinus TaxID=2505976 RepID=UPI00106E70E0|nr:hypothetical protein [Halorussus marinus]
MTNAAEEETVFVVSRSGNGGRNHVHTDPDCQHLQRAKNVFEKPRSVVNVDRLCRVCSGEYSPPKTDGPNEMRKLLSSTAPEEIGLSAIGERDGMGGGQA